MQEWFNKGKLINQIYYIKRINKNYTVVLVSQRLQKLAELRQGSSKHCICSEPDLMQKFTKLAYSDSPQSQMWAMC